MNLFQAYHHSNELVGWLSCLKTLFIFFVFFFIFNLLPLVEWAAHKPFDLGFLRFSNIFKAFAVVPYLEFSPTTSAAD